VVDQVHHGLKGVALQILSKFGQLPFNRPIKPFSAKLSDLEASKARGLFDPDAPSTPTGVELRGLLGVRAREVAPASWPVGQLATLEELEPLAYKS
jgi:hypothetical protein